MIPDVDTLRERCQALSEAGVPGLAALVALLGEVELDLADIPDLETAAPGHPYGRRVLLATDAIELMIATWARDQLCIPHDHGGSVGGVKVLQGRARHRAWRVDDGVLSPGRESTVEAGSILRCGTELIHSMGDGAAAQPLVTLHLYAASIDHMVGYDLPADRTLILAGSCGAWVPRDGEGIRQVVPGIWRRQDLTVPASAAR